MRKFLFVLIALAAASCSRTILVENPLDFDRIGEMVALDAPSGTFRLLDASGTEVPYQITHDRKLIFQASVPAGGSVRYRLIKGRPAPVDTIAVGSVRPDRLDDIIWENDRSGWRMYGPGTHMAGQKAFGYDVFTKSVPYPVMKDRFDTDHNPDSWAQMDAWRAEGLDAKADSLLNAISFHVDHGDGMDVYSVGASLGCGTAALLDENGKIVFPWCWESYEILDNGPLRFTVRVIMDGGHETRTITCDAGSWLNRVLCHFNSSLPIVAGIVIHDSNPTAYTSGPGYIAYADLGDPNPGSNGDIYCGAVIPGASEVTVEQGHILLHDSYREGFTYYFGSAWSKGGVSSLDEWASILRHELICRENPLRVNPQKPTRTISYTNPILHLDYSDPDAIRVGENYWMTASSFNCFPGLPILHSRDLVHWEQVGAALTDYPCDGSADDFRTTVHHGKAVWAPAIRYHDGWYYIYVGDPDRGIFMVRTQDPAGKWEAPVWVVRQKGFIDPCPLWDDDGRAWLSHGLAGSRAGLKSVLFVAPMSADGTRLEGPSRIVYDGHETQPTIEGTKFYKRDGWYYIFSPAGGVATGWQTVLRSKDPYGPYEERIVMAWSPGTINGPHQGAWVQATDGSDWFIHFQDKGAYGRIVHLQPMQWLADGWPLIGEDPDGDGVGQPVAGGSVALSQALRKNAQKRVTGGSFEPDDAQKQAIMRNGWQYPAIPSPYWQMDLPDGGVRLYSVEQKWPYTSLWDCPNVLQQKFAAESFTVKARLNFCPNPQLKARGETAGFVVMGNDYAGLRLTDTAEGAVLTRIECIGASKGASEKASQLSVLPYESHPLPHQYESNNVPLVDYPDIQEAVVWVKLEVDPRPVEGNVPDAVCHFYYSTDGTVWIPAGEEFIAKPELWIGAKWGFFCNRFAPKNDSGWLDVHIL